MSNLSCVSCSCVLLLLLLLMMLMMLMLLLLPESACTSLCCAIFMLLIVVLAVLRSLMMQPSARQHSMHAGYFQTPFLQRPPATRSPLNPSLCPGQASRTAHLITRVLWPRPLPSIL